MVTGEYGYLAPDGVYRTTVYSSSPQTGYVVLAQTREQRGKEEDKEFEFNYTTVDSQVNHEGHHHEVTPCIMWCHYILICRLLDTATPPKQGGTGGMVRMGTGGW